MSFPFWKLNDPHRKSLKVFNFQRGFGWSAFFTEQEISSFNSATTNNLVIKQSINYKAATTGLSHKAPNGNTRFIPEACAQVNRFFRKNPVKSTEFAKLFSVANFPYKLSEYRDFQSCRKTKTKAITSASHNRRKGCNETQARENASAQVMIDLGLACHWLRKWREFSWPSVVAQNQSKWVYQQMDREKHKRSWTPKTAGSKRNLNL